MPKTYKEFKDTVNSKEFKFSASFWIQDAVKKLEERDVCDALRDI